MYKMPLSVPTLTGNELQYVKECIDTEWVSSAGKYVTLFEEKIADYAENNHWLNLLQIDREIYGSGRERLMSRLEKNGIQTRPVWALNHKQRPYKDYQIYKIERAGELVERSLCLPSSTNLNHAEIDILINHLSSTTKIV